MIYTKDEAMARIIEKRDLAIEIATLERAAKMVCNACDAELPFNGVKHTHEDPIGHWECKAIKLREEIARLRALRGK